MQITSTGAKREAIFKEFYVLEQSNKYQFIFNSSEYDVVSRKTCENSRRVKSLKYFFEINDVKIRVCKPFYLGALSINQKMVYNVHMKSRTMAYSITGLINAQVRRKCGGRYSQKNIAFTL